MSMEIEDSNTNQVLLINRLVQNEDGRMVWTSEAVTDQKVMTAYLKQRHCIDQLSEYQKYNIF